MRFVLVLTVLNLSFFACAMGGKPVIRKEQDSIWRPCQDFEVSDPVGKLCNGYYEENKKKAQRKVRSKDFCKEEDFNFFRSLGSVMLDEDML